MYKSGLCILMCIGYSWLWTPPVKISRSQKGIRARARVKHEFTKYITRTLFEVNTVYARFDYETARPLNDFNTTLIQTYYALYDLKGKENPEQMYV